MNKSIFRNLAIASILLFSTAIYSTSTYSHQTESDRHTTGMGHMGMMGHMPMMGGQHMGMMGHMPMMGGRHMGMMGHMPMMGGCYGGISGVTGDLGLNNQQQQKANNVKFELRKKHWELMGRMIDQQAALQNAYASERPDPKTVGAVYSQIFELKREMIEAALEANNKLMDTLTEDQRNQVRKMHQGHSGMMQGQGMMDHCGTKTN